MLHNCARNLKLPPPSHDSDNREDDDAGDEENDENPSLLLCILSRRFTDPYPVMQVLVMCVCVGGGGGGAEACVRVCASDEMSVSMCLYKRSVLFRDGAP